MLNELVTFEQELSALSASIKSCRAFHINFLNNNNNLLVDIAMVTPANFTFLISPGVQQLEAETGRESRNRVLARRPERPGIKERAAS